MALRIPIAVTSLALLGAFANAQYVYPYRQCEYLALHDDRLSTF